MDTPDHELTVGTQAVFHNPWPPLGVGVMATAIGLLFRSEPIVCLSFEIVGLLAAAAAIVIRPKAAGVLAAAALVGLLASFGMAAWESVAMVLRALMAVAATAALVLLLPRFWRRLAFSLIILFHFSCLFCTIPDSWVSRQLWPRVYRPYMEFLFLNAGYGFYAPDPGPGILLWSYIQYEDGSGQWYKIPDRDQHSQTLEYERYRTLAHRSVPDESSDPVPPEILQRRQYAATQLGILGHPALSPSAQYRSPDWYSKKMLTSYARHIAHDTPHPDRPELRVTGVKIYCVVHAVLEPRMMADGRRPDDKTLYRPFYQGDYRPDGTLRDPDDPMLYWLVPILTREDAKRALAEFGSAGQTDSLAKTLEVDPEEPEVVNQLELHARRVKQSRGWVPLYR